ncbi:MAG: cyclic nucleotide-binding domain-containing protein [Anaerolineae bacterium]
MSIEQKLKAVPFFSDFDQTQLAKLVAIGQIETYEARQIVLQEGDDSNELYVILHGSVRIYKHDAKGKEVELKAESSGEFFGELALLDGGKRSATVATLTPCEFFVLHRDAFLSLLQASPSLLGKMFTALAADVRATGERYFREELEKQRLQTEMELERHRALAQMVAGVAHELNTPLGIINTAAGLIRQRLQSDVMSKLVMDRKMKSTMEDIVEASVLMEGNVRRAHQLVQSFKNVSVSQIADTKERLDIAEVINETLSLFKINARKAKLDINFEDALGEHTHIWHGYRGYLSRVLLNLLTNIERYAYPRDTGGKADILLSANDSKGVYIVTVRDYGKGIPAENMTRVFDPFFTTGRADGGTGLGLAIVHNIVTSALHGTVTLESAEGKGTTFTLTFPQTIDD